MSWFLHLSENSSSQSNAAEAALNVKFPNVDWISLQSTYGWAALQYQAWARGYLEVAADSSLIVSLFVENVLEFWVDDGHYFGGDFYAYRKAPLVLHLAPGKHKLDIRLIRDVRAMGAVGEPEIFIKLRAQEAKGGLQVCHERLLIADVVNGKLASSFASVPVRNESEEFIEILEVASQEVSSLRFRLFFRMLTHSGDYCDDSFISKSCFQSCTRSDKTFGLLRRVSWFLSGSRSYENYV